MEIDAKLDQALDLLHAIARRVEAVEQRLDRANVGIAECKAGISAMRDDVTLIKSQVWKLGEKLLSEPERNEVVGAGSSSGSGSATPMPMAAKTR